MAPWHALPGLLVPRRRARWSIDVWRGPDPFRLAPSRATPVFEPGSVAGMAAHGVADPFMLHEGGRWWMFFELDSRHTGRGEIALASSADNTTTWRFEGSVLREPFHLSYPHVFEFEGAHYLLPECSASGAVRLYRALDFPRRWTLHAELMRGDLSDATPVRHAGRWWLFALEGFRSSPAMVIYFADRLEGPWHPHAGNPFRRPGSIAVRPAGRIIGHEGRLIRFAQDGAHHYGRAVRAFVVDELTPQTYAEHAAHDAPVLGPSGAGWNATGMHHVDAHPLGPGDWVACVDGRRTVWHWPLADRLAARFAPH